ncbi:MAG: formylglycine-generating enzyme family protein [Verrucomicrobia bacterium]|nr:formylglycine-generating enzyme family protein [Verrucomicrobiota bacterium]
MSHIAACLKLVPFKDRPTEPDPGDECYLDLTPKQPREATRMVFCWCPPTPAAGFLVGHDGDAPTGGEAGKQPRAVIPQGYWLGKHLVTQAQWQALMGSDPSKKGHGDFHPVDSVSHDMTGEFAEKSRKLMPDGLELWLPTEAQWEWACRAGTTTPFGIGAGLSLNSQLANIDGNYPDGSEASAFKWQFRDKTLPVGVFPPNAWGLHDMHGQLWEWCQDWLDAPNERDAGRQRVLRGGCWIYLGRDARSAYRYGCQPRLVSDFFGFRACPSSIQARAGGQQSGAERRQE